MRLSGASNDFFNCFFTGEGSFDIYIKFTFKDLINTDNMKQAAREAMKLFPEFDIRPVIRDNKVEFVQNGAEPVFSEDADSVRYYGTKDTNGFLLYFICSGKKLTAVFYHGLTDIVGIMAYLKAMFAIYFRSIGIDKLDDEFLSSVRTPEAPKHPANKDDMFDPYRLYGDKDAVPEYTFESDGALIVPTNDFSPSENRVHEYLIDVSTSEFIAQTKKLGVSFIPLIVDIVANTVFDNYDTGDKPFIAMVPVNLRPLFGSVTCVNFSDGVSVPVYKQDKGLSISERCAKTKDIMRKQINRGSFAKLMAAKAAMVDSVHADKSDILSRKPNVTTGGSVAFSLPVTYPGKMSVGAAEDGFFDDITVTAGVCVNSLVIHTFGDKMEFVLDWQSDDDTFAAQMCEQLKKYGFSPVLKDNGIKKHNLLELGRLERIGG